MTNSDSYHGAPSAQVSPESRRTAALAVAVFLLLTIAGLAYVKWWPYFGKAMKAIDTHTLGSSILKDSQNAWRAAWDYSVVYFNSVWKAAVLGMLVGAMVQVLLPANWLRRVMGRMTFASTLAGGVASLPGMMCTCCAAPVAVGMRRRQVSIGASLAFWIGNPMLNPATLVFMTAVLSWKFTVLRLAFGILLTFGVSYAAGRFADRDKLAAVVPPPDAGERNPEVTGPLWLRWVKSVAGMAIRIVPTYVVSVFLVGLLQQLMLPSWASEGAAAIVLFAVIGTLFVIPTAAEIPIVQSFLAIDRGSAAALLVTLPAVSLPSLLLVARSFPKKALALVALSVAATGIVCGWIGRLWL